MKGQTAVLDVCVSCTDIVFFFKGEPPLEQEQAIQYLLSDSFALYSPLYLGSRIYYSDSALV